MKTPSIFFLFYLAVSLICSTRSAMAQFAVQKNVLAGGGSSASNNLLNAHCTIGQTSVGNINNTHYIASIGFWFGITSTVSAVGERNNANAIEGYRLDGAFPNPFSIADGGTNIRFSLPTRSFVLLKVFDATGREIMNLIESEIDAGTHSVKIRPVNWNPGMYICHLSAMPQDKSAATQITLLRKMVFIR